MLTRDNQKIDVIYCIDQRETPSGYVQELDERTYFVTTDGEGRFWYDSLAEAREAHGDLPVRYGDVLAWEP